MAKVIYKYPIDAEFGADIALPADHRVLSVGEQNGELFAWIMIDPDKPHSRTVTFLVVGTAQNIDRSTLDQYKYFCSVQLQPYCWHVFHNGN